MMKVGTIRKAPQRATAARCAASVAESGLPGFEFNPWFTLMASAGTPAAIVNRLHAEVVKARADWEMKARFDGLGLTPRAPRRSN